MGTFMQGLVALAVWVGAYVLFVLPVLHAIGAYAAA
jgi:hypothetical protein